MGHAIAGALEFVEGRVYTNTIPFICTTLIAAICEMSPLHLYARDTSLLKSSGFWSRHSNKSHSGSPSMARFHVRYSVTQIAASGFFMFMFGLLTFLTAFRSTKRKVWGYVEFSISRQYWVLPSHWLWNFVHVVWRSEPLFHFTSCRCHHGKFCFLLHYYCLRGVAWVWRSNTPIPTLPRSHVLFSW